MTFLARKVFNDGGSAATGVAVAYALRDELEALAEASTKLRFLMLRVADVALRHLATVVTGDDWAGAMPTDWQPVWLWLSYACGCTGVAGSPLRASAACAVCGEARTNNRNAPAHAKLSERYPKLMTSLAYGLEQMLDVASPACDRYLPSSSNTARWVPVATVVTTHVERCVQAACRKLGVKAADTALRAAAAAPIEGASGQDCRRRLARSAAARFLAGTAGKAARGRRLKGVPDALLDALAREVAGIWAAMPASAAALLPATPARTGRWWLYVPFLSHVLTAGVQGPYALIPGARAALHAHGTLEAAKMLALIRRVSSATGSPVRGRGNLRSWPELSKGGAAVLAAMAGVGTRSGRISAQLSTDGVAATFYASRPDTPAEAEARAVHWATQQATAGGRRKGGAGVRSAVHAGALTQLERSGVPLGSVRRMQVVGVDPGRSCILTAAPGECVSTTDLPARPVVDAMRAAWARRLGLDALNRACAALLCGKDDAAGDASATVSGHQQAHVKQGKRPASAVAGGGGRAAKRRQKAGMEGSSDLPSAEQTGKTCQTAMPGRGHRRVRRGPDATRRRAGRTKLAAAVRRVLRRTRLHRWKVPRHEAEAVARRLVTNAGSSSSALLERVEALPRRKGHRRLAPMPGIRYEVSAAQFREASGGNFKARAWKLWRQRAETAPAARAGSDTDMPPPVDEAAAHGTMRTGDHEQQLRATRAWAALRETAEYRERFGAEATRALRAAALHQTIQRGRFAAAMARDLTGGLLRQVRGGTVVVVAMGTARVRGGDGWVRRYVRRLCWFVDQDEFNTSQACPCCHQKLVMVYPTGNSPPTLPAELFGPPVTAPGRRVRMAAGSRRGQPMRPRPSADHKTRRGSEVDTFRASARATAHAAAVARRAVALANWAVEDRGLYADRSRSSAWSVKGCITEGGPARPVFVNRDCIAAVNIAWATARRLKYANVWPFKRPWRMKWSWSTIRPPDSAPVPPQRRERATVRVDAWPPQGTRVGVAGDGGGAGASGGGCGGGAWGADGDVPGGGLCSAPRRREAPLGDPPVAVDSAHDGARRTGTLATEEPRGPVDAAGR